MKHKQTGLLLKSLWAIRLCNIELTLCLCLCVFLRIFLLAWTMENKLEQNYFITVPNLYTMHRDNNRFKYNSFQKILTVESSL